jgi:hypothetical protein
MENGALRGDDAGRLGAARKPTGENQSRRLRDDNYALADLAAEKVGCRCLAAAGSTCEHDPAAAISVCGVLPVCAVAIRIAGQHAGGSELL